MVFSWRLFLVGALLGAGLVVLWAYLSLPQGKDIPRAENGPAETEAFVGREKPFPPGTPSIGERGKAEGRAYKSSRRVLMLRASPDETISEIEDRVTERGPRSGESSLAE